ncbi:MAG: tRNA pseudouridine(38-40) synthase TruA [Candidatus Nanopelagicales bacterium]
MTRSDIEPVGAPERSGPDGLVGVPGHPPEVVRLRLLVTYDGAGFCGWARQPGLRSVQGELETAVRVALRIPGDIPVRVAVAGRTDAGVHATGQVCHADVPAQAWRAADDPRAGWVRLRCNGLLERDVRVRALDVAPAGFHARWSAVWRRYRYLVADDPASQDPRTRGHVLWHPRPLDEAAMSAAAEPFLGEHDFAAFCRARPGASSVRTVHEISWRRTGPGHAASPVEFEVRADAFCHSMVRSLVGVFLAVGDGRWPVARPAELLRAAARLPLIEAAPAHPLTLVEVGYPPDADLGAQALRARRWRGR